jgi:ketol-acid reductoisomerase
MQNACVVNDTKSEECKTDLLKEKRIRLCGNLKDIVRKIKMIDMLLEDKECQIKGEERK